MPRGSPQACGLGHGAAAGREPPEPGGVTATGHFGLRRRAFGMGHMSCGLWAWFPHCMSAGFPGPRTYLGLACPKLPLPWEQPLSQL